MPLPLDSLPALGRGEECPPSPPGGTLERGVLLWMAPDGLYARRLCQERVFWEGGLSPYGDKPNKLEREHTCKLLHTQDYFAGELTYTAGRHAPTHVSFTGKPNHSLLSCCFLVMNRKQISPNFLEI